MVGFPRRVQSVALRLIVEREREIQNFIPKEYWLISAVFAPDGSQKTYTARLVKINGADLDLPDEKAANQVVEDLHQSDYLLDSIKRSQRNIRPSAPFITSTMQQDASRRLGFSTKKTMAVAQQLYEGIDIGNGGETGLITYMRTDSVHVAPQPSRRQEHSSRLIMAMIIYLHRCPNIKPAPLPRRKRTKLSARPL